LIQGYFPPTAELPTPIFSQAATTRHLAWAVKALRQYQPLPALWVSMASQALTGRVDEARAVYKVYRQLHPSARIANIREGIPSRRDENIQKFVQGFRLAGMPE
jgi:hypothetical protein